jgi:hypothetical protein
MDRPMTTQTQYRVLSPDGIDTEPQTYNTIRQAKKALTRFKNRYTAQGYYLDNRWNKIHLDDIIDYCDIIKI